MLKNLLTAMITLCSLTANAFTVQEMIEICKTSNSKYFYCVGEASGVMATMRVNEVYTKTGPRVCEDSFISNGQAVKIFLNWADKNPADWQIHSTTGFMIAFREAYPCK